MGGRLRAGSGGVVVTRQALCNTGAPASSIRGLELWVRFPVAAWPTLSFFDHSHFSYSSEAQQQIALETGMSFEFMGRFNGKLYLKQSFQGKVRSSLQGYSYSTLTLFLHRLSWQSPGLALDF